MRALGRELPCWAGLRDVLEETVDSGAFSNWIRVQVQNTFEDRDLYEVTLCQVLWDGADTRGQP